MIPLSPAGEIEKLSKWDRVGPDLLAALVLAEEALDMDGAWPETLNRVRAAIAQAKGE
jgi:hypothetical protein